MKTNQLNFFPGTTFRLHKLQYTGDAMIPSIYELTFSHYIALRDRRGPFLLTVIHTSTSTDADKPIL